MKLERIHSGSNKQRQVSISELLSNFIFGGHKPKRFVPGNNYSAGDMIYEVTESGDTNLYICNNSGTYVTLDNTNWSLADVQSMISQQIVHRFGIEESSTLTVGLSYDVYITGDLDVYQNRIKLPDTCTEHSKLILFLDGKYESSDLGDFVINLKNRMKYIEVSHSFNEYILYVVTPNNHAGRLITFLDRHPTSLTVKSDRLSVYIPGEVQDNSYALNVYVDGKYLPPSTYEISYDEETDNVEIKFNRKANILPEDIKRYVISIVSSRSKYIKVNKVWFSMPIQTSINKYRVDGLEDCDIIHNCPLVFCADKALPSNYFTVHNNTMSVTSSDYYGEIGDIYSVISYEFSLSISDTIYDTYGSIIVDDDERKIAIPIIGYNDDIDVLVFRKAGTLINQNRYYIHDGSICLYDHDDTIIGGDLLSVQVLNSDRTLTTCSMITSIRADKTVVIPNGLQTSQFLLFSTDGRYIGKHLYNVSNGLISFINECDLEYGDSVEIIYNKYKSGYTATVTKVLSTVVTKENEFVLPIKVFSSDDNYIIFNATTGVSIRPTSYKIDTTGVVTITDGTGLESGDMIDVYVSRELRTYVYTDAVDKIVANI